MLKTTKKTPSATASSITAGAAPAAFDPATFKVAGVNVTKATLKIGEKLHRIHKDAYTALQYNPGFGNARFSPIKDASGNAIPTMYAGETFECAAMESVFHDVSFHPGQKTHAKSGLIDQLHSAIESTTQLILADLSVKALHKLGIPRNALIDTEKDQYPFTRTVAEAIHAQCPDIQGIRWTSRQDDEAYAYVFFADRIDVKSFAHTGASLNIVSDPATYLSLLKLAQVIGVNIVP